MENNFKRRMTALAVAGAIAAGGGISEIESKEDPLLKSHIDHDRRQIEYYDYLENADLSYYDEDFVNFYREGIIKINNIEYSVNDLYLEFGINGDVEKKLLIYYKYPNNDIITAESKDGFRRTAVMLFKDTYCFYEIYLLYKDLILDNYLTIDEYNIDTILTKIKEYDGSIHVEVPETSYGRIKR